MEFLKTLDANEVPVKARGGGRVSRDLSSSKP
jgi:hypothetical protein